MDHAKDRSAPPSAKARPAPQPLQRAIVLRSGPGCIEGRVEDNVHDFSVRITHDGQVVTSITGGAHRVPWTSCPFAVQPLEALVGAPLAGGGRGIDQSLQCTHLFDLARLALGHASRSGKLRYDLDIAAEALPDAARARLWRDGALVLDWRMQGDVVAAGGPFTGHKASGRAVWPPAVEACPDMVEAALVLRRGLLIFRGRRRAADANRASELPHMTGACFSFQSARAANAWRPRNFVDYPTAPIQGRLVSEGASSLPETN